MTVELPAPDSGEPEFDFGDLDFGDNGSSPASSSDNEGGEAGGDNPAWKSLTDLLPSEFHPQIKPILSQWDKGVQDLATKIRGEYAPFEEFRKQQISAEELMQAKGLYDQLNQNPVQFYERMRDTLLSRGMIQEAAQVQQQIEDMEDEEDEQQQFADPRVDQLAQQQQQLIQGLQAQAAAQAQAQATAAAETQIANELADIERQVGKMPEFLQEELFNRANLMSQRFNRPVPLREAYLELQQVRQQLMSIPRPGQRSPRVVPGGGGYPAPQPNPEALKTAEGREAAIAEIVRRHAES